jgi:hypothetical protein
MSASNPNIQLRGKKTQEKAKTWISEEEKSIETAGFCKGLTAASNIANSISEAELGESLTPLEQEAIKDTANAIKEGINNKKKKARCPVKKV